MIELGNHRVSKIAKDNQVVYQDSGGWIPLELPEGVSGKVLFKDNRDGTGQLIGTVGFQCSTINPTTITLLQAPNGISFVSTDNWTYFNESEPCSVDFTTQQVQVGGFSRGSGSATVKAVGGDLVANVPRANSLYVSGMVMSYINFCLATTKYAALEDKQRSFADPAILKIEYTK